MVLNGKGSRSYPNPQGPESYQAVARNREGERSDEYVARMQTGSASFIQPLTDDALDDYTAQVPAQLALQRRNAGRESRRAFRAAIQHVIYIVKENRTYDQVLGDIGRATSDPSLCLFGEKVTPNHHKLAREFVLLDNFYVNAT